MSADKLARALRNYTSALKACATAAKVYNEAVREVGPQQPRLSFKTPQVYEPGWPARNDITAMTQSLDLLWDDYHDKLAEQTLGPLVAYSAQFLDVRQKVDKRGRKLLDYDSARHALMSLTTGTPGRGKDEIKVSRAQETLANAQQMYATLNDELLHELPTLYDNRIMFYTTNMQTQFNLAHR